MDEWSSEPLIEKLKEAVKVPLGMLQPRPGTTIASNETVVAISATRLGYLLAGRALELAGRRQPTEAFDTAFVALALSRHLRSNASSGMFQTGTNIERVILSIMPVLVEAADLQPDLVHQALNRLISHNTSVPGVGDTLRFEYLKAKQWISSPEPAHNGQLLDDRVLLPIAWQMPWERERARRILDSSFANLLRASEFTYAVAMQQAGTNLGQPGWSFGPICLRAPVSKYEWPSLHERPSMSDLYYQSLWQPNWIGNASYVLMEDYAGRTNRLGTQLQTALALYRMRNGKTAQLLTELVPDILVELPRDPFTGEDFHYRISDGEKIRQMDNFELAYTMDEENVMHGQGIVWSVGADLVDQNGRSSMKSTWAGYAWHCDVVFVVPWVNKP